MRMHGVNERGAGAKLWAAITTNDPKTITSHRPSFMHRTSQEPRLAPFMGATPDLTAARRWAAGVWLPPTERWGGCGGGGGLGLGGGGGGGGGGLFLGGGGGEGEAGLGDCWGDGLCQSHEGSTGPDGPPLTETYRLRVEYPPFWK